MEPDAPGADSTGAQAAEATAALMDDEQKQQWHESHAHAAPDAVVPELQATHVPVGTDSLGGTQPLEEKVNVTAKPKIKTMSADLDTGNAPEAIKPPTPEDAGPETTAPPPETTVAAAETPMALKPERMAAATTDVAASGAQAVDAAADAAAAAAAAEEAPAPAEAAAADATETPAGMPRPRAAEASQPAQKKKFLGVIERRSGGGKVYWEANGYVNSTTKYLGSFSTPEEAASTYDNFLAQNISSGHIVLGRWNRKRRYNFPERILKIYTDENSEARQLALTQLGRGTLANIHRSSMPDQAGNRPMPYSGDVSGAASLGVRQREEEMWRPDAQYQNKYLRTAGGGYSQYYGGQMQVPGYPQQAVPMAHPQNGQAAFQPQQAMMAGASPYDRSGYDAQQNFQWYSQGFSQPGGEATGLGQDGATDMYGGRMAYARNMGVPPRQYDTGAYVDPRGAVQGVAAVQHAQPALVDKFGHVQRPAAAATSEGFGDQRQHASYGFHSAGMNGGYGQQVPYANQDPFAVAGRPTNGMAVQAAPDNGQYAGWANPSTPAIGVMQNQTGRWQAAAMVHGKVHEIGVYDDPTRAGEAYDDFLCNFISTSSLASRDVAKFQFNYPARIVSNPHVSVVAKDLAHAQIESRRAHGVAAAPAPMSSMSSMTAMTSMPQYPNGSKPAAMAARNAMPDGAFRPEANVQGVGEPQASAAMPRGGYPLADNKMPNTMGVAMPSTGGTPNFAAYYQMNGHANGFAPTSLPAVAPSQDTQSQMAAYYRPSGVLPQHGGHGLVQDGMPHGAPPHGAQSSPGPAGAGHGL